MQGEAPGFFKNTTRAPSRPARVYKNPSHAHKSKQKTLPVRIGSGRGMRVGSSLVIFAHPYM
jgi:hypothetical protein